MSDLLSDGGMDPRAKYEAERVTKLYVGLLYAEETKIVPTIFCASFFEAEIRKKVDDAGPSAWLATFIQIP